MKQFTLFCLFISGLAQPLSAQVLNGSFENWTAGLPDNWWGFNIPPYNTFAQTLDAHSGTFAVNLHVDDLGGSPISSPLSTGNGNVTTHPLTFVPGSISFWYKLTAMGGDELTISSVVYSGGTGMGYAISALPAAASYTNVTLPFFYGGTPPATADFLSIIFLISNQSGSPTINSNAVIDDMSISTAVGVTNIAAADVSFGPNPADYVINFMLPPNAGTCNIMICDKSGRTVYTTSSTDALISIPTAALIPGLYHCRIMTDDQMYAKRFLVVHGRW